MPPDTASGATLITVALAAVAAVSAAVGGVLNYLAGRDKLRFDVEVVQLRKDMAECHEERAGLKEKMEQATEQAAVARSKADKMEGEIRGLQLQVASLGGEVLELRDRLHKRFQ